jgi:hypothetical protein
MKGVRQTAAVREKKAVFPVQISTYNSRHAAGRISSILQTRRQYGRRLLTDSRSDKNKRSSKNKGKKEERKKERKSCKPIKHINLAQESREDVLGNERCEGDNRRSVPQKLSEALSR